MSLETWPHGQRDSRTLPVLTMILILNLTACAQLVQIASADNAASDNGSLTMNFHMRSLIYSNSVSIFIYNGADTNPPIYATPITTPVSCSSSSLDFGQFLPSSAQTWFSEGNIWFGGVSWITQPLAEDLTIRGNASITVWMSSSDPNVAKSGYVFGISESDSMANMVGDPVYEYYYNDGSVLRSAPGPYRLTLDVDRTFTKGNLIAFFVGVGSTSERWQYQVYFDSPSANSSAELPVAGAAVPEFSQMGVLATVTFAVLASYMLTRRRNRSYLSSG